MSDPVLFNSVAPCMFVSDLNNSLSFYCDVLGFKKVHLEGDPPVYGTLHRDRSTIHLARDSTGAKLGSCSCYFYVSRVDSLYKHCLDRNVVITRRIEDSPYGMRDFICTDPDGNTISFGESIP